MTSRAAVDAEVRRAARVVGLKSFATPSLEAVERRRSQLWVVMIAMITGLAAIAVVSSMWFHSDNLLLLSPRLLRLSIVAVTVAFAVYAYEQERNLRRLTVLLADEKALTAALSNRLQEVTALVAVGRAVNSVLDLPKVLEVIMNSALELLRGSDGSIMLLEKDDRLRAVCVVGNDAARDASVGLGEGIAGQVGQSMEGVLVEGDARSDRDRPVDSAISVPLVNRGELVGVLNINAAPGHTFSEYELRAVSMFGEQAATAIANARMYENERAHSAELEHRAFHDPLTQLPNRALLTKRVDWALSDPVKQSIAVLFLDLDDFKEINDTAGHGVGDLVLIAVAERIQHALRKDSLVTRLGGDEFAVLVCGDVTEDGGAAIAKRILGALNDPLRLGDHRLQVSGSVGVAVSNGEDITSEDLLRNADLAMYAAKQAGKNRFACYTPEMHSAAVDRVHLEHELAGAVERREFVLYYQPIVDVENRHPVAMEALVRWNHPTRGLIPPAEFIGMAERTGLIADIGRWVLGEACRQAASWTSRVPGGDECGINVNLSPRQLEDDTIVTDVAAALATSGLRPERLVLELTETVLIDEPSQVVQRLEALKQLGVRLAVDDFGTGYSSLTSLHRFPIDILKIDKAFVESMDSPHRAKALASSIVALAGKLELITVAEGVERAEQLARLKAMQCEFAQGFYMSRPLDADAAVRFLAREMIAVA